MDLTVTLSICMDIAQFEDVLEKGFATVWFPIPRSAVALPQSVA